MWSSYRRQQHRIHHTPSSVSSFLFSFFASFVCRLAYRAPIRFHVQFLATNKQDPQNIHHQQKERNDDNEWMDEWMDEWMIEWMNEWMDGWMNEQWVFVLSVYNADWFGCNSIGWNNNTIAIQSLLVWGGGKACLWLEDSFFLSISFFVRLSSFGIIIYQTHYYYC